MLFRFLKYIQPTYYFSIPKRDGSSVFPIVSELPIEITEQLSVYKKYTSNRAKEYDLSWQALQKGYIGNTKTYHHFETVPVVDEYRFVRRYFNPLWTLYILFLRIISFKNPLVECSAWFKARDTVRSDYLKNPLNHSDWEAYNSLLVQDAPLVSVIIPTLNRYEYLKDVLTDLEAQDYPNFELLVVDQSEPFQPAFYEEYKLALQLIHQEEKALWLARNTAIKRAKGDLLLLFDDDSRIDPDWITNHVKCLDFFNAEISSGISTSKVGDKVPEHYRFFRLSDQIDTGNVLIKRAVFKKNGLFDRQFEKQRMGDGEFGMRAHLAGYLNISNPFGHRLHLKVGTGGLRQMGSWDGFRPKKWLAPRPIPSVLYYFRKYYGNRRARLALLKTVPPSIMPYRFKKNKKILIFGIFISILLLPLICIQVGISWSRASKKLTEGALIRELD